MSSNPVMDRMEYLADALMVISAEELKNSGESQSKIVVSPTEGDKSAMIFPMQNGYPHPAMAMDMVKRFIEEEFESIGAGEATILAVSTEAWMVKTDKMPGDPPSLEVSPSEHEDRVEVVICFVCSKYGDNFISIKEIIRDFFGNFFALVESDIPPGEQSMVFSVFNPWQDDNLDDMMKYASQN